MTLIPGTRGDEVKQLQLKLNSLGEKLVVDGVYGNSTKNAVERFQQGHGLSIDGVAGLNTQRALNSTPEVKPDTQPSNGADSPNFDRSLFLPDNQYVKEETDKQAIVLHHTEGASAASSVESWTSNPDRIATAYLVERDGTIYEVFDPKYWAWHLGSGKMLKTNNATLANNRTIGIELANEGALELKGGKYYCFGSNREYVGRPWGFGNNEVITETWRDSTYWAAYPEAQQKATASLVSYLCSRFNIPKTIIGKLDYDKSVLLTGRGVFTHATVRTDKQDLHPGFDFDLI